MKILFWQAAEIVNLMTEYIQATAAKWTRSGFNESF